MLAGPPQHAQELVLTGSRYYHDTAIGTRRAAERGAIRQLTLDDRLERGTVLCGAPDTVVRQIENTVKALGVGTLQVRFKIGPLPHDAVVESMRLFAREVLPYVRAL